MGPAGGSGRPAPRPAPPNVDRIRGGYSAIDVPVLVCWGADDRWVPAERGRELAALVPGADLRVVDRAGHLLPEDRPAELTAALLEFLAA